MEIYNEEIKDLFAPDSRKLQIHENLEVSSLTSIAVWIWILSAKIRVSFDATGCFCRKVYLWQAWERKLSTVLNKCLDFWKLEKVILNLTLSLFTPYFAVLEMWTRFLLTSGLTVHLPNSPLPHSSWRRNSRWWSSLTLTMSYLYLVESFLIGNISIIFLNSSSSHQIINLRMFYVQLNGILEKLTWIYTVVVLTAYSVWWVPSCCHKRLITFTMLKSARLSNVLRYLSLAFGFNLYWFSWSR